MVEPRRELGLAQEALHDDVAPTQPAVQDLDDDFSSEQGLLAAIHGSEAALADSLAKDKLSNSVSAKIIFVHFVRHPAGT